MEFDMLFEPEESGRDAEAEAVGAEARAARTAAARGSTPARW